MERIPAIELVRRPLTDDDYLSDREVSDMFLISIRPLARWRQQGRGPGYRKVGRRVRYRRPDVKKWAGQQRVDDRARRR